MLLRSLPVYILKQLFFSISVNSGRIITSPLRDSVNILPLFTSISTLVPEAFFYSLLANFATRTASYIFFSLHEALRAEKRKPLVATVGNLTFMPSAFDRRFWLEDIFNCSIGHMIGWIKYLWGWEWSVYVHLYGYVWRTFALSTDSLTREG